jgi:quinolinate synthase
MKEHLASYPYEKPSLDYMQTHIEFAAEAQQSNACTLHEAWAKVLQH